MKNSASKKYGEAQNIVSPPDTPLLKPPPPLPLSSSLSSSAAAGDPRDRERASTDVADGGYLQGEAAVQHLCNFM
jgi:hypothetical protein